MRQKEPKNKEAGIILSGIENLTEFLSTVCITILDEQRPLLHTAYIGDSSYLLLRLVEGNLKVLHHSPEQQKEFNFPFQVIVLKKNLEITFS